jgi:putative SOS response-associated peptidase YedK
MRRFAQAIADASSLPPGLPTTVPQALAAAPDRYNVSAGTPAAILMIDEDGVVQVKEMIWGLVPRWSKGPNTPYTTVAARLDRAPQSRLYAQAWKKRHCVIAMSGYYKWDRQHQPPWPHFIQRKDGLALLAAGLWEKWEGPDGASLRSFSVLTAANAAIPAPLTPDGPVFVDSWMAMEWLSPISRSPAWLAKNARTPALESYTVGRAIRDPGRDDYTLLEPISPDVAVGEVGAPEDGAWVDSEE